MIQRRSYLFIGFAIIASAAIIRIYLSLTTPLRYCEIAFHAIRLLEHGWKDLLPFSPGLSILYAGFMRVFGQNFIILKLANAIFSTLTIVIVYKLSKEAYGVIAASLSALILAIFPLHVGWAHVIEGYTIPTLLITLSLYCLYKANIVQSKKWVLFGCISVFLAFNMKTFYLACVGGLFIFLLLQWAHKKKDKKVYLGKAKHTLLFLIALFILLSPVFIWRYRLLGKWFYTDRGDNIIESELARHYGHLVLEHFDYYSILLQLIIPILAIFIFLYFFDKQKRFINSLLISYISSYFFLTIISPQHHAPRGVLPAVPMLSIVIGYALAYLFKRVTTSRFTLSYLASIAAVQGYFLVYYKNNYLVLDSVKNLLKVIIYHICIPFLISFIVILCGSYFVFRYVSRKNVSKIVSLFLFLGLMICLGLFCFLNIKKQVLDIYGKYEFYYSAYDFLPYRETMSFRYESGGGDQFYGHVKDAETFVLEKDKSELLEMSKTPFEFLENEQINYITTGELKDLFTISYRAKAENPPSFYERITSSTKVIRLYDNGKLATICYPYLVKNSERLERFKISVDVDPLFNVRRTEMTEVFFPYVTIKAGKNVIQDKEVFFDFVDMDKDGVFDRIMAEGVLEKNGTSGRSFNFSGDAYSVIDIGSDGSYATLGKFPLEKINENLIFSFIIRNNALAKNAYTYNIFISDYTIDARSLYETSIGGHKWAPVSFYAGSDTSFYAGSDMRMDLINTKRSSVLRGDLDIKPDNYKVYCLVTEITDNIDLYVGDKKMKKIKESISHNFKDYAAIYGTWLDLAEEGGSINIFAVRQDDSGEGFVQIDKILFDRANNREIEEILAPRATGVVSLASGDEEEINIKLPLKGPLPKRVDVITYDQRTKSFYNIYFWVK
ncbi:glycosyltransferase family 39 protein [Candidatus Omnitrophota bacterium]